MTPEEQSLADDKMRAETRQVLVHIILCGATGAALLVASVVFWKYFSVFLTNTN